MFEMMGYDMDKEQVEIMVTSEIVTTPDPNSHRQQSRR